MQRNEQAEAMEPVRAIFATLGGLTGAFGLHNFYAGYRRRGIAQILVTVLTAGIGVLITAPWALIEVFRVKTDAAGRKMT